MKTLYGSINEAKLYSHYLNKEMSLLVYLPPNYSPLYSYHLLIAQDGKDYFQLGRIARQAEELISNDAIEDIIIIGVPYETIQERRNMYHPNGEQFASYLRFLAEELVSFAEQQYQTFSLAGGRTLIGDSLGGTVSLLTALQYPNTFGQVILQSPFVNSFVLEQMSLFTNDHLKLYHVIGNEETAVDMTNGQRRDFLTPNRELSRLIKNSNSTYHYHEFDGNHRWTYWQADLKRALHYMFSK